MRDYVFDVFERQNRAVAAIATISMDRAKLRDAETVAALEQAEDRLNEACGPLNRAVSRRMNDQDDDGLGFVVLATLDDCSTAAYEAEAVVRAAAPQLGTEMLDSPAAHTALTAPP
jgi:hypothetical protein